MSYGAPTMKAMALYDVTITLTTRGIRNPRTSSAYEVFRADGRLIKTLDYIGNDPRALWARVEAFTAAKRDAAANGIELDEKQVEYTIRERTVDARGRQR